jgi:hypothetical protein
MKVVTAAEIARTILEEVATRWRTTPEILISYRHPKRLLQARVEVAKALRARGWSGTRICAAMHRDHTMASFYLGALSGKQPRSRVPLAPLPVAKPKPPRGPIKYAGWDPTEGVAKVQQNTHNRCATDG